MATKTFTVPDFPLYSSWTYAWNNGQGYYYGGMTPTTDSKTVTIDLSSIESGSTVKSATLAVETTRNGTTGAKYNNKNYNINGDHIGANAVDVTAWFPTIPASAAIVFSYQAYGSSSGSSPKSTNRCNFSNIVLTINYEPPNSTGTLDKTDVDIGDTITLSISQFSENTTHTVTWKFGSHSINGTINNLQSSWTIPAEYLSEISSGTSAQASVELKTFKDGNVQVGTTQTYIFNIKVPDSVKPNTGTLSITVVNGLNGTAGVSAAQGFSSAALTLTGMTAGTGSSIESVVFTGAGEPITGTLNGSAYQATTDVFDTAGTVTITATVTDKRGRSSATTKDIQVYQYVKPVITAITAQRCASDGTADDSGEYAKVVVNCDYAGINGNNAIDSSEIWYQMTGNTAYTRAKDPQDHDAVLNFSSATPTGTTIRTVANVSGVIANINPDSSYNIKVVVRDKLQTSSNQTEAVVYIQTTSYVLHFRNGGTSIGIGQAALNADKTLAINPEWSLMIGKYNDSSQTINVSQEISDLKTAVGSDVSADNITGTLAIAHGGTGGTTVAAAKTNLGFVQQEVVTASNNAAVAANANMFSVGINLAEGDMWQGIAVLGVNSSTNTDFLVFFDDDYAVANYRSYLRHGTSNAVENGCMMAFTGTASKKCVARFTVSMLGGMAIVTGQCIRGDGKIGDFVIAKAVSGVTNLVIRPSAAVTAGHGSAIRLTKVY